MEFSTVQELCLHRIKDADYRSRFADSQSFSLALHLCILLFEFQVGKVFAVSDTGIGSCLEEFQDLRFSSTDFADNWGQLFCPREMVLSCPHIILIGIGACVFILRIMDTEIHSYQINLKERGSSRITILPSNTKNGAKFSGSEAYLSCFVSRDLLLSDIRTFIQKNIAIQLVAEDCDVPESRYEKIFLANECKQLPMSASNLELLKEQLKVGIGVACCTDNRLNTELVMEAVILMSNISMQNIACFREYDNRTEVLYFKDFSPCTISRSSMKALQSIDWKTYGLNLRGTVEQDGVTLLEWENLPTDTHIDIVLHTMIPAPRKLSPLNRNLVKRAVKLSLDDLKANHSQAFLSSRALQIRGYAPDLAKTIAGLILSSSDLDFQGECFSLLGLQSQEVGTEIVESCIEKRIVSVIEMNDKKPNNSQQVAPYLFEELENPVQDSEFQENDFSPLDF
ncbi:hypothetical protein V8G54_015055 [Vigna mungo]|uniref:Type 2 DNA topoisomerase 6 subunit B-like n=1 Tax=Vigna mungo TaxID=3915 RepID=A0AAQ3NKI9_VIGMU